MFSRGFRMGMMLQLAVGPVCLYVFQVAARQGLGAAWSAVFGVALVDALYILAAILGLASLLGNRSLRTGLAYAGAAVLVIFGADMIAGVFGRSFLPVLELTGSQAGDGHPFLGALLLTASNPLTILFWAGLFAASLLAERRTRREMLLYGSGAVGATLIFLTLVTVLGDFTRMLMTPAFMKGLNGAVGLGFLGFGIRMGIRGKRENRHSG